MTSWALRAAGNRSFSPSTLDNGLALPIDLQQRAESHEEAVPSWRDEIIAPVTRLESTRTLPACLAASVGLPRRGWMACEWRGKEAGIRAANHNHIASRTNRAAGRLRGASSHRRQREEGLLSRYDDEASLHPCGCHRFKGASRSQPDKKTSRTWVSREADLRRRLCSVFLQLRRILASSSCSGHTLKEGNQMCESQPVTLTTVAPCKRSTRAWQVVSGVGNSGPPVGHVLIWGFIVYHGRQKFFKTTGNWESTLHDAAREKCTTTINHV